MLITLRVFFPAFLLSVTFNILFKDAKNLQKAVFLWVFSGSVFWFSVPSLAVVLLVVLLASWLSLFVACHPDQADDAFWDSVVFESEPAVMGCPVAVHCITDPVVGFHG